MLAEQVSAQAAPGTSVVLVAAPALCVLLLGLRNPAWGLGLFLVFRSVADAAGAFSVAACGGVAVNPASSLGGAMLLLGVLSVPGVMKKRPQVLLPWLFLAAGTVWSAGGGLLRFGGAHLGEVLREVIRLAALGGVFACACRPFRGKDRAVILGCLSLSVLVCGAWGIVQYLSGGGVVEKTSGVRRSAGPFAYPNTLGYVLLLGITVLVSQWAVKPRRFRWYRACVLLFLLIACACTVSFTIFGLCLLAVGLVAFVAGRRGVLLAVAAACLFSLPLMLPRVGMLLRSEVSLDLETSFPKNTLTARFVIWRHLLGLVSESPLCGWGLRSTPLVNPIRRYRSDVGADPHNDFILFLLEGGLLGLSALVAFHLSMLRLLQKAVICVRATPWEGIAVGFFVVYLVSVAGSTVNNLLSFTAYLSMLFSAAGLLLGKATEQGNPAKGDPVRGA